ncbi:hypothetical protein HZA97_05025 [Candidatus Woesearchaeota archaeon]|nr:hypothetical protein [Candidatus Woesearchaeota archaeon]
MSKFEEADERIFKNKFVCRKCKSVIKSPRKKIFDKTATCVRCGSHHFKPKRKK